MQVKEKMRAYGWRSCQRVEIEGPRYPAYTMPGSGWRDRQQKAKSRAEARPPQKEAKWKHQRKREEGGRRSRDFFCERELRRPRELARLRLGLGGRILLVVA
jgi:hypothetical protein